MTSQTHYVTGPAQETWQAALLRFAQFCHADHVDDADADPADQIAINLGDYYDDGTLFEIARKEPLSRIQNYQAAYGITVPPALVDLMCNHGAFSIYKVMLRFDSRHGGRKFLEIYSGEMDIFPNIVPLCMKIADNYTATFAETELSKAQIACLDANYFCFGSLLYDDQDREYLYFDRQHRFGSLRFQDEDADQNLKELAPLLSGTIAPLSLDKLLSASMDKTIAMVWEYSVATS
jgi:hypothetical protein